MPNFSIPFRKFAGAKTRRVRVEEPDKITVNGRNYDLVIRRHMRAKSITLRTDPATNSLRVTSPPGVPVRQITDFIQEKCGWIERSFAKAGPVIHIRPGARIQFRGQNCVIDWRFDLPRRIAYNEGILALGGPEEFVSKRVTAWLKAQARTTFSRDISDYSALAGIEPPRLALSSARRRWGSCSDSGTIRINWRLIMAPDDVRRSVVAHEIAHVRHMDHSAAFYRWLDSLYEGDRKQADRWLKDHGARLHAVQAD